MPGRWSLGTPINAVYVAFALFMALFTECTTKVFVLWHAIGLGSTVVLSMVFRMGEHHIEEQAKDDPPAQEIKRAEVSWR